MDNLSKKNGKRRQGLFHCMYAAAYYSGNIKGVQTVPAPHNVQFIWLVHSSVLAIT